MNKIKIIRFIHYSIILFILFTPFCCNNKYVLETHIILIKYLLLRWITNYHKCNLTELEYKLRGVKKDDGFIYSIIKPIFDINKTKFNYLCYFIVVVLWYLSYKKCYGL